MKKWIRFLFCFCCPALLCCSVFLPSIASADVTDGIKIFAGGMSMSNGMGTSSSFTVLGGCSNGARLIIESQHGGTTPTDGYIAFAVAPTSTQALLTSAGSVGNTGVQATLDNITSGSHVLRGFSENGGGDTVIIFQFCSPATPSTGGGGAGFNPGTGTSTPPTFYNYLSADGIITGFFLLLLVLLAFVTLFFRS